MTPKQSWKFLCCLILVAFTFAWDGNTSTYVQAQDDSTPSPSRQLNNDNNPLRNLTYANSPDELLAKAQSQGNIRVIVGLNARFQPEGGLSAAQVQAQRGGLVQVRLSLMQTLAPYRATVVAQSDQWTIPYMALEVDTAALQTLQSSQQISSIQEDHLNFMFNNTESLTNMGVLPAWTNGHDGTGYTVAVLDVGVQGSHTFLGSSARMVGEYCSSTFDNTTYAPFVTISPLCPSGVQLASGPGAADPAYCMSLMLPGEYCDHGTHVAGIAAGNDGNSPVPDGVARGATIIGAQVFSYIDCLGSNPYCFSASDDGLGAFDSNMIAGLNYVYSLHDTYQIASVNMSIGGGKYSNQAVCDSENPHMKAAIDQLRSVNIATIIASGNEYYTNGIAYPACISSAIAVGSVSDYAEYAGGIPGKISSFTNTNFMLDLMASGFNIYSSVTVPTNTGFDWMDGTSMAAPQVTGAWAVVRSALPNASVTKILQTFQQTGTSVKDDVRADGLFCGFSGLSPCSNLTFKVINVDAVINSLMPTVPVLSAPLANAMTSGKPTFRWTAQRANQYEIQLDTVYPPAAPPILVNASSYTPATPLDPKVYYWQVRSRNNLGGVSEWSEMRSFVPDVPPDRNYFGAVATVTLTWNRVTWATGYEVQYADNAAFTNAQPPTPLSVDTLSFTTPSLADGRWYWRVRALKGANPPGPWNVTQTFVVDVVP
jgi:subtilisin family serine protease